MTAFKFCGLRTEDDVAAANEIMPDLAGFVIVPGTKRYVPEEEAERLAGMLVNISPVAVLRDAPLADAKRIANSGAFAYIQLHGKESDGYVKSLKNETRIRVIKTFTIEEMDEAEDSSADLVMFDGTEPGSGRKYDISKLEGFPRNYILAGGLGPDNVRDAINKLAPFAVDVSSGIETDGRKDVLRMRAFADAVRQIQ